MNTNVAGNSAGLGMSERPYRNLIFVLSQNMRVLASIGATLVALLGASSGYAADWEGLSDGRVAIEVKGVRLAFPTNGSDVRLITFDGSGRKLTLEEVIASPAEAQSVFAQSDVINVHIPVVTDRKDRWLFAFDRWEFRSLSLGIAIGASAAVTNCQAWEDDFRRLNADVNASDARIGPDGWAEFVRGKSPSSHIYLDTRAPTFFSGVICNDLNACYVPKCLSSNVGLSYSFTKAVHERASWRAFNMRVQDVLKSILIDLVK